jgi:hypothetical protein
MVDEIRDWLAHGGPRLPIPDSARGGGVARPGLRVAPGAEAPGAA